MKRLSLVFAVLLSAISFAQSKPVPVAQLQAQTKFDGTTLSYSVGPIEVAAHTKAGEVGSRFQAEALVPEEGWLIGLNEKPVFHNASDTKVLPRVQIWNETREDVLCTGRDERIAIYFAGAPKWPSLDNYGYHVRKNDRVRISIEVNNPGDSAYKADDVMVTLTMQPINSGAVRQDVWPLWFDTKGCGPSEYDLKPGSNIASGSFEVGVDGNIIAIQAALRKFGEQMLIENQTRAEEVLKVGAEPIPVSKPPDGTEWRLNKGDLITVVATYRNPTKKELPIAATGIALGLLVPSDPSQMNALDRNAPKQATDQSSR